MISAVRLLDDTGGGSLAVGQRQRHVHPVPFLASAMALGAGVVWSFGAVAARKADGADAFQYLLWRSIAVVVVVEVAALVRRRPPLTVAARRGGTPMFLGCATLALASLAFIYAVKNTSPANAAFLGSMAPLLAVVLARFVLGELLTLVTVVAVAVGLVGVAITIGGDLDGGDMAGNVAALLAALGFAGYTVCVRSDRRRDWSPVLPGYGLLMIVVCGAVTIAGGRTLVPPLADIALAALHGGLFIVVGTLLYNHASRQVPAVAMAVFAQTEMILVPVWAFLVLGDSPPATSIVGGIVIASAAIGKAIVDALPRRSAVGP